MDSGYYYLRQFTADKSMQHFGEAVVMAKEMDNDFFYAAALLGAGQATWYAGNMRNAADTLKKAIDAFPSSYVGDIIGAYRILSNIYDDLGEYENAFKSVQTAMSMNHDAGEHNRVLPLVQLGKLYQNIGDMESAFHYFTLALEENPRPGDYPFRELYHCLGRWYVARNQFDSASYFYHISLKGNPSSRLIRLRLGELLLLQKKYDSAYIYLQPLYEQMREANDVNFEAGTSIGLAKIAHERGDLQKAQALAYNAYKLATEKAVFRFREEASVLLSSIMEEMGNASSALRYRKIYDSLRAAASSDIYKGQLFAFRQKSEAASHAAAVQSLRATIIILCLAAALIIAFIVFRYQHMRLQLKQRASDLEMQALRAQMSPHFIFNCLSAINHFILDNQNDKASDYLTRFSRLMRMVLVNAGKDAIPLDEELDMLRLYLEMEQLRFKHVFTYSIHVSGDIPSSKLLVPCFILQPFCENAIWHGLLHKEGEGKLVVDVSYPGKKLKVTIRDNGIGREKAAELSRRKHSSMGQQLTASRLTLFNKQKDAASSVKVNDLTDDKGRVAGTEIVLFINPQTL